MYNGNKTRHARGAGGRPPRGRGRAGQGRQGGDRGLPPAPDPLPRAGPREATPARKPGSPQPATGSPPVPRPAAERLREPAATASHRRHCRSRSSWPPRPGVPAVLLFPHPHRARHRRDNMASQPPRGAVLSSPGSQFLSSSRSGCYNYEVCSSALRELPTALGGGTGEVGYR